MNEVTGGSLCPQCNTANSSMAAYCNGCGAALGRSPHAQPLPSTPAQVLYQEYQAYQSPTTAPTQFIQGYQPQSSPHTYAQPYEAPYAPPAYEQRYESPQAASGYAEPQRYQPYAPQYPQHAAPISVNVSPIINVQVPMPQQAPPIVVLNTTRQGPSMIVRVLWFLCIGLWLGLLATVVGWLLCVAVITLPIGLVILNRLPAIMTLRPASSSMQVVHANGVTTIHTNVGAAQRSFLLRAIYFVLVGWWATAIWLALAWGLVGLSVFTLGFSLAPAFVMFERVPQVLTLRVN